MDFLKLKKQKGHFLIHMAEVLVSAGLVVGVAMQSSLYLEKMEYQTTYNDLRAIENSLWSDHETHGAWLDQCTHSAKKHLSVEMSTSCGQEVLDLVKILNNKVSESNDIKYDIKPIRLPNGTIKRAILIENTPAEMADWLNQKIDGDRPFDEGRVRYNLKENSQIAYLYESSLY